jgi:hypothetical protein
MFSTLLKAIFLPKETRELLADRERLEPRLGPRPGGKGTGGRRSADAKTGGRDRVMQNALKVYRQQREVYESLDAETRQQIEADAAQLFGDLGKRQR